VRGREREAKALELRIAGATYKQIGEALGISESGAWKAVMRALKRLNERIEEGALELRRLETERIDRALLAIWPRVRGGDLGAIDRFVKLSRRRAELWGLDAPKALDVTTEGGPLILRVVYEDQGGDA